MTTRMCHDSSNSFLRTRSVFHLPNVFHAMTLCSIPGIRFHSLITVPSLSTACASNSLAVGTSVHGLSGGTTGSCGMCCSLCTGGLCSSRGALMSNISSPMVRGVIPGRVNGIRAIFRIGTPGG